MSRQPSKFEGKKFRCSGWTDGEIAEIMHNSRTRLSYDIYDSQGTLITEHSMTINMFNQGVNAGWIKVLDD